MIHLDTNFLIRALVHGSPQDEALTDLQTGASVAVTFVSKDDKHTAMDVKTKD